MNEHSFDRRRFLAATITTLSVGFAGCSTDTEGGSSTSKSDSGTSGTESGKKDGKYSVKIIYHGQWEGSFKSDSVSKSIQGSGNKTYDVDGNPSIVSANVQKSRKDSGEELTIRILKGDEVVQESTTTAAFGVVQVSTSAYYSGDGNGSKK